MVLGPNVLDRLATAHLAAGNPRVRRSVAGLLALAALVLGVHDLLAPERPGTAVIAASRDLVPGAAVDDADLTEIVVPTENLPDGAVRDRADVLALTVAGPIRRGEILTDIRLLSPRLTEAVLGDSDARVVPVRPGDTAMVELLRAGDRIDILAVDDQHGAESRTVAENALVVVVPETVELRNRPLLVALPADQAANLAAASLVSGLTVTLR